MAFSTSNVQTAMLSSAVKVYCGDWSGTAGDAAGTITLNGGRVYLAHFRSEDTTGPQEEPDTSVSVSGSTLTMSVYNHQTVVNGRFLIIYA